jgi:hypothetical protein
VGNVSCYTIQFSSVLDYFKLSAIVVPPVEFFVQEHNGVFSMCAQFCTTWKRKLTVRIVCERSFELEFGNCVYDY